MTISIKDNEITISFAIEHKGQIEMTYGTWPTIMLATSAVGSYSSHRFQICSTCKQSKANLRSQRSLDIFRCLGCGCPGWTCLCASRFGTPFGCPFRALLGAPVDSCDSSFKRAEIFAPSRVRCLASEMKDDKPVLGQEATGNRAFTGAWRVCRIV